MMEKNELGRAAELALAMYSSCRTDLECSGNSRWRCTLLP